MARTNSTEFAEQCAVIAWARMSSGKYPELKWLHSSLNGVWLPIGLARKMRQAGMTRGVLDLFLPVRRHGNGGLYIEMKNGRNKPTPEQLEFIDFARAEGFECNVCYSADKAIELIEAYLNG